MAFPGVLSIIRALRLPAPNTESLIYSLLRSNRSSPSSLPCGGELRWARSRSSPVPLANVGWSNTGPPRFLGNPSSYLCPALGPRSVWRASPLRLAQCCPQHLKNEDTNGWFISRLNHTASVPAAYASSSALPHSHARLASGWWLAFTGRESNPLDSNDWFPSPTTSSNPRLRLALSNANCNTWLV